MRHWVSNNRRRCKRSSTRSLYALPSISTAFSMRGCRVSSFLASSIHRHIFLAVGVAEFFKASEQAFILHQPFEFGGNSTVLSSSSFQTTTSMVSPGPLPICSRTPLSTPSMCSVAPHLMSEPV